MVPHDRRPGASRPSCGSGSAGVDGADGPGPAAPSAAERSTRSLARRAREADEYYTALLPEGLDDERAKVVRQASRRPGVEQAVLPVPA